MSKQCLPRSVGETASILIIEDDSVAGEIMVRILEREGYQTSLVASFQETHREVLRKFDLCIIDLMLPDGSGVELLRWIKRHSPDLPCLMVSAIDKSNAAVAALKSGAIDYLAKPLSPSILLREVGRVMGNSKALPKGFGVLRIPWKSSAMQQVQRQLEEAARSRCPVLINGPVGSGKLKVAEWIHKLSSSGQDSLRSLNLCDRDEGEVTEELFGRVVAGNRDIRTPGLVKRAAGSTLLLRSVDCLPAAAQLELLSHIEKQPYFSDSFSEARLISSSRKSFEQLLQGGFDERLLHDLSPIYIQIPALDEIPEDIEQWGALILSDLRLRGGVHASGLTSDAWNKLRATSWPLNLLGLRRVLEGAFATASASLIGEADLNCPAEEVTDVRAGPSFKLGSTKIFELEKISLEAALRACNGNRRCAAKRLGVSLRTIYNMIARHEISNKGKLT